MPDAFQAASLAPSVNNLEQQRVSRFDRPQPTIMGSQAAPQASSQTPASPPASAPAEPSISAKFTAIARKERQIYEQKQAHKAAQAALAAKEAALAAREARLAEFEGLRANPVKALEYTGHSYQDLTQTVLNEGNLTAEQIARQTQAELKAFKEAQEAASSERAKEQDAQRAQEEQQILQSFQSEVANFVQKHSSEYEFTVAAGRSDLVFQTIEAHFNKTGELLPVKQAAEMTERYIESEVEKMMALPKARSKFAPSAPEPSKLDLTAWRAKEPATQMSPARQPTRTLTNSAAPVAAGQQTGRLSEEERIHRARLRLRGQSF